VVGGWEINGLEPNVGGYHFTRTGVLETLLAASPSGALQPGLAQAYRVSDDLLTWRFTLRSGARFHDGSPVEAAWVGRMIERAAARPGLLKVVPIAAIAADNDSVVIRLARPYALLPSVLTHSTTAILAAASFGPGGQTERIIGSGAFQIDELVPPQRFSIKQFTGWNGPPVAVQRATYLSAGRAESRALLAQSAQADLVFGIDAPSMVRLARQPHLRILRVTLPRTYIVKVNAGHRWLKDVAFREALSLAVDRQGIALALLRDRSLAATQLLPPTLETWHSAALPPLRFDMAAAATRLDKAGYALGRDGLRTTPQGERLALTLTTYPDRPELPLIATALQEKWRQLGITVRLSIGNSSDIPRLHAQGTLEMGLAARNFALSPDPTASLAQDFSPRGGDWGAMNWTSEAVVTSLARLAEGVAPSEAPALRERVVQILHRELPVIPVAWSQQAVAVNARLTGVIVDPFERSFRLEAVRFVAKESGA
jgi:peptide/nickel transport system substrate-binding protein